MSQTITIDPVTRLEGHGKITIQLNGQGEVENASLQQQIPCVVVPKLLKVVRPIHEYVKVDVFLPGCPPSADTFHTALTALLTGGPLDISELTRFGA